MGALPIAMMAAVYYFFAAIVSAIKYSGAKSDGDVVKARVKHLKVIVPKYKDSKKKKLISSDYTYVLTLTSLDGQEVEVDYVETVPDGQVTEYENGGTLDVFYAPGQTKVKAVGDMKKKMTGNITGFFVSLAAIAVCFGILYLLDA